MSRVWTSKAGSRLSRIAAIKGRCAHTTSRSRKGFLTAALLSSCVLIGSPVLAQNESPDVLWNNANHFVLVAQPDLAKGFIDRLLELDNSTLLDAVEAGSYDDTALLRMSRMEEPFASAAQELLRKVQLARIEKARDADRIANDIDLLDEGSRPYRNAVERLKAAGAYAAPQMLAVLTDNDQADMHPFVTQAMAEIGEELVYPLSTALPDLTPDAQAQVAQVLASIGYPQALPALKQVVENDATDSTAAKVVEAAYRRIANAADVADDARAADLYLFRAQGEYEAQTESIQLLNFDSAMDKGIVWHYDIKLGLVPILVDPDVFGDVLAMRSTAAALALDEELGPALSLYLTANLRRENTLAGDADPSYSENNKPPAFYLMLAGPEHQHDVLGMAIKDRDAELALDALAAISETNGFDVMINTSNNVVRAMSFFDRRVRFRAAEALANARPTSGFVGSEFVVPVLAESVRLSDERYAVVISENQQQRNATSAALRDFGFEVVAGATVAGIEDSLAVLPGVDVIVVNDSAGNVLGFMPSTLGQPKLAQVPVLAVVNIADQVRLQPYTSDLPRLRLAARPADLIDIEAAVDAAVASHSGGTLDPEDAQPLAIAAIDALKQISLASDVFDITVAEPALLLGLVDERDEVVLASADLLATLTSVTAQQALAEAALDADGDLQIRLLVTLAESATHHGNQLNEGQLEALIGLIDSDDDMLAVAASRAHGALSLSTGRAVDQILP